jgi:adenylosuccinate synthase
VKNAFVVVDLGYGDSGKGTVVDALVRRYGAELVVRFNGGAQAGHNVVDAISGKHHCFAQFGSGTFVPGCRTLLAGPCLVNPLAMVHEEAHLVKQGVTGAFNRMYVDGRCLMTTPYHRMANRLRELARGDNRHGSCGMGIGETVAYATAALTMAPVIEDVLQPELLETKLQHLRTVMRQTVGRFPLDLTNKIVVKELSTMDVPVSDLVQRYVAWGQKVTILNDPMEVAELLNRYDTAIMEGAQGVLLDENYGFHPYTTWSTTTARNAHVVLDEAEVRCPRTVIGVIRAYATRHGAGPFVGQDDLLTQALPDEYNPENPWQSKLRCGWWNLDILRYSIDVAKTNGGLDALAVTCLDQIARVGDFRLTEGLRSSQPFALKPLDADDLEARKRQSAQLERVRPITSCRVENLKTDDLANLFSVGLRIPLALYSEGRTSVEKTFTTGVLADPHA